MKPVSFAPLHRWTSAGLLLSNGCGSVLRSADDTNSFTILVRRAVSRARPRQVVDLGCGSGIPTVEAAARGARCVHGVDNSASNAALARSNVARAGLEGRVFVHFADWRVLLEEAKPDLIVSNPPYVPEGGHATVDGGPDGAAVARAIVDAAPGSARGLALLFGSISNPLSLVRHMEERDWRIRRLSAHIVPFGAYTSRAATLEVLRALRREGLAWYHETHAFGGCPLRTYIVFGAIAERGPRARGMSGALTALLETYQRNGTWRPEQTSMPVPIDAGIYRTAMSCAPTPRPGTGDLAARHDAALPVSAGARLEQASSTSADAA